MNMRIWLLKGYIPTFVKNAKLRELSELTARAFGYNPPNLNSVCFNQNLKSFALFTKGAADTAISDGRDLDAIRSNLYDHAYKMGIELKEKLNLDSREDILSAISFVYKLLKIDFHCDPQGAVEIKKCYFSSYYNSETCKLISALDAGLVAGLSNGWKLEFGQRITEMKSCCKGQLSVTGKSG